MVVEIIGRSSAVRGAVETHEALLLVVGDSGIGKSSLLRAVASELYPDDPSRFVGVLSSHDGSLQTVVLEQIAELLLRRTESLTDSAHVEAAARSVVEKLPQATATEIGRLLAKAMLGYLRSKIGGEALEILQNMFSSLAHDGDGPLEAQLRNTVDAHAVRTLLQFASEASAALGGFVVLLDRADLLSDSDFGLLTDLVDLCPSGVRFVVGHSERNAEEARRVRRARQRGVVEVRLDPLILQDIESWLNGEGLSTESAQHVLDISGGYPILVDACIPYLHAGRPLPESEQADFLLETTRQAWLDLPVDVRACARILCAFDDPPTPERIEVATNASSSTWNSMREDLLEAKIFSLGPNGIAWFHDLRLRLIRDQLLSTEERLQTAEAMAPCVSEWAGVDSEVGGGDENLVALVRLASDAPRFVTEHPGVAAVLELDVAELGYMFGLLELSVEQAESGPAAADALTISDYVAEHLDVDFELVPVLVLAGRSILAFGKKPIPHAATIAFDFVLENAISPFVSGGYGLGRASVADHYRTLQEETDTSGSPPAVVAEAKFGPRSLYLAATFDSVVERDSAYEHLHGLEVEVFGERLKVTDVTQLPATRVRATRFAEAAAEILGIQSVQTLRTDLERPMGIRRALETRVATVEFLRDRLGALERNVADIKLGRRFAWTERGTRAMVAEISSADRRVDAVEFDLDGGPSPTFRFERVAKATGVKRNERLLQVQMRGHEWKTEPALDEIAKITSKLEAFNRLQPRTEILANQEEGLSEQLNEGLQARLSDVKALVESGLILGRDRSNLSGARYVVIYPMAPSTRRGPDWGCDYVISERSPCSPRSNPRQDGGTTYWRHPTRGIRTSVWPSARRR